MLFETIQERIWYTLQQFCLKKNVIMMAMCNDYRIIDRVL